MEMRCDYCFGPLNAGMSCGNPNCDGLSANPPTLKASITLSKTEFRVREHKRYIVTRYDEAADGSGSVVEKGVYDNEELAHEVAQALAREEVDRLGLSPGDGRVQFPKRYDMDRSMTVSAELPAGHHSSSDMSELSRVYRDPNQQDMFDK